jgi:PadR family transcriptional regulator, regulatory protein PadR
LRRHPDANGYEVCRALRTLGGTAADDLQRTVYPQLFGLEREGFAESRWAEPADGSPRRRVYRITGRGEQALDAARGDAAGARNPRASTI